MTKDEIKANAPDGATCYLWTGVEILYLNDNHERWSEFYKQFIPVVLGCGFSYIKPLS